MFSLRNDQQSPIRRVAVTVGVFTLAASMMSAEPASAVTTLDIGGSRNMELVAQLDLPGAISIAFSTRRPYAFVNTRGNTDSAIVSLDISDPAQPRILDRLPLDGAGAEDLNIAERTDGTTFLVATGSSPLTQTMWDKVNIVDVRDPGDLKVKTFDVPAQHSWTCVTPECFYAYGAGRPGSEPGTNVSDILDLRDPDHATVVAEKIPSLVALGHDWNRDGAGVMWHVGDDGIAAYDATVPTAPVPVNASSPEGNQFPYNEVGHHLHGTLRPNAERFLPGTTDGSVHRGNVLLATEEGNNTDCTDSFQTWYVPSLSADVFAAANPGAEASKGSIVPLDTWSLLEDTTPGVTRPVTYNFCSVHWFDYHQSGYVVMAAYGAGTRVLDVTDARHITEVAYHFTGNDDAVSSYWVPQRGVDGRVTGRASTFVYTTDAGPSATVPAAITLGGGIRVFRVTLPK